jgi:hypothetical protein
MTPKRTAEPQALRSSNYKTRSAVSDLAAAAGTTGPAFSAFGQRAVALNYMTQEQLDQVAQRLVDTDDDQREAAVVEAMRRFIALNQPLSNNMRLKGFHIKSLNGLPVRCYTNAPPGGTPEVYNIAIRLPGELEEWLDLRVNPRYLRPGKHAASPDPYASRIPADGRAANLWFKKVVADFESMERLKKELFTPKVHAKFGPVRPANKVKGQGKPEPTKRKRKQSKDRTLKKRKARKLEAVEPEWVEVEDKNEDDDLKKKRILLSTELVRTSPWMREH